jgi:hypothetical protein
VVERFNLLHLTVVGEDNHADGGEHVSLSRCTVANGGGMPESVSLASDTFSCRRAREHLEVDAV